MAKKYLLRGFFSLVISSFGLLSFAQNPGIDSYNTGELEIAKSYFEKQLTQNPAEANYYLGEIAYEQGNKAEATSFYEKGLAADPQYALNLVGMGKILLPTDLKAAESQFSAAVKIDKKDINVLLAISKAYFQNGMQDKANSRLDDARKVNKNSPLVYIWQGDMLRAEEKVGEAAGMYSQAINFDPSYTIPYIKTAQIYERINPNTAVEMLEKVLQLEPNYTLAYKYLGDINYHAGRYGSAIDAYEKFFAAGDYSVSDLTNYAAALYFSHDYDKAKKIIEEGIAKEPNNFVLNRLLMYSAVESKDFENGLNVANKFFTLEKNGGDYIAKDHMAFAELLSENNDFDKALEQYDLAIKLDPKQYEVYKEIATTLASAGRSLDAANYFRKYINAAGEDEIVALDFYNMGRNYYFVAGDLMKDTENPESIQKAKEYLMSADSAFATVAERIPDNTTGSLWRGRANSLIDNIEAQSTQKLAGYAKPYYEAVIEINNKKEDGPNVRELTEAYNYLLSYYYFEYDDTKSSEAKSQALLNADRLLSLDPENASARQIKDALQ